MTTTQLDLPMDLDHRPLRAVPYVAHDGKWADATDAQHLSLGRAQWNPHDLAVKIFRHGEQRWSRQSEELPVHRAIDLTMFLALALFGGTDAMPSGTLENQTQPLNMRPSGTPSRDQIEREYAEDITRARERLRRLRLILEDLYRQGAL